MPPEQQEPYQDTFYSDMNTRLRDIEEKQRLLKDRLLLVGETLVQQRDKSFSEIQEAKKAIIELKEESKRIKEILQRITEQLSNVARKEEILILQRQLDLLRKQ
jgi:hypothetical protein